MRLSFMIILRKYELFGTSKTVIKEDQLGSVEKIRRPDFFGYDSQEFQ